MVGALGRRRKAPGRWARQKLFRALLGFADAGTLPSGCLLDQKGHSANTKQKIIGRLALPNE